MEITKEIKKLMIDMDITAVELNEKLNEKNGTNYSNQNLSKKLSKSSLQFKDVEDILDLLGYELKIVKKQGRLNSIH